MFRAHALIIRRSKLHYTASGIITLIGGRLMHTCARDTPLTKLILKLIDLKLFRVLPEILK